jgi:hypothetical protein
MVQDTTAVDRTRPQQQVTGAGPMDFNFRREAFFHPMVAFSYVVIFEPSEWKSVYATLGIKLPETGCPTLIEVFRAIARQGGFRDRPKIESGTHTLWVGLQRCYDLSNAWDIFGPSAKKVFIDYLCSTTSGLLGGRRRNAVAISEKYRILAN